MKKGFSVIMPTYNRSSFIRRAIHSLFLQTIDNWELIIIDDGSTDDTAEMVRDYSTHPKVRYYKNEVNKGLCYALNKGISHACYEWIAYLPADDFYYKDHLASLQPGLELNEENILCYTKAYSGKSDSWLVESQQAFIRKSFQGLFYNCSMQLVQVAHQRTNDKWEERENLLTENLFRMFWIKLIGKGIFHFVDSETCHWTIHNFQRSVTIPEINSETASFPLYPWSTEKGSQKNKFIENKKTDSSVKRSHDSLKILLLGDLSHNYSRIYALKEKGHTLYGLWTQEPRWSTVGPLEGIEDIPYESWEKEIRRIQPDIIYGLLNYVSIDTIYEVMVKIPAIPFIWHFKEGPSACIAKQTWAKLIALFKRADGKIFINRESKDWFNLFLPSYDDTTSFIVDGDMPSSIHLKNNFSPLLSDIDGEIHTVVPGRIIGLEMDDLYQMRKERIHLHVYSATEHKKQLFSNYFWDTFHIHPHCQVQNWVKEFSQYDAGWIHNFTSHNEGELVRASWDDLNIPARINTLAIAGLPIIQQDNTGHIVATQRITKELGVGVFYKDFKELGHTLRNRTKMQEIRRNMIANRHLFTFDHHVNSLLSFFYTILRKTN